MQLFPRSWQQWIAALVRVGVALSAFALVAGGVLAWGQAMPGSSALGPPPALGPEGRAVRERLRADVRFLAVDLGVRHSGYPDRLRAAANRLEKGLRGPGRRVRQLPFQLGRRTVANVESEQRGVTRPSEVVVIGAHYDTAPPTPGADDNASGVAALLELARGLRGQRLARTVRFVAFVNEEPPYFQTESMGSLVYAKSCKQQGDNIVAMISLESLGYYDATPGSQTYPPFVRWLFPDRGDFLAFVGRVQGRGLVREAIGVFRAHAALPSEGLAAPTRLQGVDWSDHWSFWQAGYPAIMVSDTAVMRNPHYHKPTDLPETLDWLRFTHAVEGLRPVVAQLAGGLVAD